MKKLIATTLLSIVFATVAFSQNKPKMETVGIFYISEATIDGEGVMFLQNNVYFYTSKEDSIIYMSNYSHSGNTQSFGPLNSLNNLGEIDTVDFYNSVVYSGNWEYQNTYDSDYGNAAIEIFTVYSIARTEMTIRIYTDQLETLEYRGEFVGDLNFNIQELTKIKD